jgi:protocatechuate 3,4-dioxygenase beta subunit
MSKNIRHISVLKLESGLTMTSGNDSSYPNPLRPFARARRVILPLICVVSLLMCPPPANSDASAGPANESVPLKIKVVDGASREPITGAEVSTRFLGDIEGPDRINLSTAVDGCCDVSVPQPQPERVSVYVQAEGYVPVRARWSNSDNPPVHEAVPQLLECPLEKGTSIGGVVKNKKGEPIAGAKVDLSLHGREGRIRYYVEHSVRTGADGKWRSDSLPKELDELSMEIEHPEYVPTDLWISSAPHLKGKLRDFSAVTVLDDGITVTGFVHDHQGEPIEKALLMTGRSGYFTRIARTDQHGRFEFKHCKFEPLYLSAQAPGKSPVVRRVIEQDLLKPLKFTLEPGHSIRLRVVDAHGTPLEGVRVIPESYQGYRYILKPDPGESAKWRGVGAHVVTDEKGRVSWNSAPPDAVEYAFSKEGFARLSDVAIVADGTEHLVTLTKPVTVRGTVVDKNTGRPIKRFRVVPVLGWLSGGTPFIRRENAFEANDGEFEWKVSRTDTGHYVRIEADGHMPVMSEMFRVADAESRTYRFELQSGTNITGAVVGADSKPIEGAKVCLGTPLEYLDLYNGKLNDPEDAYVVETGKDGAFSFPPVATPALIAVLHEDGYAQVTAGQLGASPQVCLRPWSRVEGKLVQDGKSVKDHQVRLSRVGLDNPDSPRLFARYDTQTDNEGRFVFDHVIPGPVLLEPDLGAWEQSELTSSQHLPLMVQPGRTYKVALNSTGRTVVGKVVLPPGLTREMTWSHGINYFVALKDGVPVPDEIKKLDFDWRRGFSDTWNGSREGRAYFQTLHKHFVKLKPDGSFRIDGVKAGRYDFVLRIYDPPQGGG